MASTATANPENTKARPSTECSMGEAGSRSQRLTAATGSRLARSAPRARPPVDPPERIAAAVLADAEELVAGTRSGRGHACLQLVRLSPPGQRPEAWKDQGDLGIWKGPAPLKETQGIAAPDRPPRRTDGAAMKLTEDLQTRPALGRHEAGSKGQLFSADVAVDPCRSARSSGRVETELELDSIGLKHRRRERPIPQQMPGQVIRRRSRRSSDAADSQPQPEPGPVPPRVHAGEDQQGENPCRQQKEPGHLRGGAVPLQDKPQRGHAGYPPGRPQQTVLRAVAKAESAARSGPRPACRRPYPGHACQGDGRAPAPPAA